MDLNNKSETTHTEVDVSSDPERATTVDGVDVVRKRPKWWTVVDILFGTGEEDLPAPEVLKRKSIRRGLLFLVVLIAVLALTGRESDSREYLYTSHHAAMALIAVVNSGWIPLLVPITIVALLWLYVFARDQEEQAREARQRISDTKLDRSISQRSMDFVVAHLPTSGAKWDPSPFRGFLTGSNRFVIQVCAAITAILLFVSLIESPLVAALAIATYLILVPNLTQWAALKWLEHKDKQCAGIGEVLYIQHTLYPVVVAGGFAILASMGPASSALRQLTWVVVVLVSVHVLFVILWWSVSGSRAGKRKGDAQARRRFRLRVVRRAKFDGMAVFGALAVCAAYPLLSSLNATKIAKAALKEKLENENSALEAVTIDEVKKAELALFLVSDNQFRALDGKPSVAHTNMIDDLVPVAIRPVELDLLSVASIDHFACVYNGLIEDAPDVQFAWAHLGDFADLACRSELNRFADRATCFGHETFAGFAPGNHDTHFTGNFSWHPDWDEEKACQHPGPDDGPVSRIETPTFTDDLTEVIQVGQDKVFASTVDDGVDHLATMSNLGMLGTQRVVGIFIDTSDFAGWAFGAAGLQGEISDDQMTWILDEVDKLEPSAIVLLFQHHPVDDLAWMGRRRVDNIADRLGDRLLAVVSGHTHQSQHRLVELDDREVHEFIVGSTTDPPQEAALLTIAPGEHPGKAELRFQTMPAVAREGTTQGVGTIKWSTCETRFKELETLCECRPLLLDEKPTCSGEKEEDCSEHDDPLVESACETANRARRLFDCTERTRNPPKKEKEEDTPLEAAKTEYTGRKANGQLPTKDWWDRGFKNPPNKDPNPYRAYEDNCKDGAEKKPVDRHHELLCLSWVASVLQDLDEDGGWTFARAREVASERLAASQAWKFEVRVDIPVVGAADGATPTAKAGAANGND